MFVYLYVKSAEDISIFDDVLKLFNKDNVRILTEHKKSFRGLDEICSRYQADDVVVIGSIMSLGCSNIDVAAWLGKFIENEMLLVIADSSATYDFGVSQPLNKAVLSGILKTFLDGHRNIIEMPRSNRSNSGRNRLAYPDNWENLYEQWTNNEITSSEFMKLSGLKKGTFYNILAEYKEIQEKLKEYSMEYRCI